MPTLSTDLPLTPTSTPHGSYTLYKGVLSYGEGITIKKQHSLARSSSSLSSSVVSRLVVGIELEWSSTRSLEESSGSGIALVPSFSITFLLYT
jgi:hypothetical protein